MNKKEREILELLYNAFNTLMMELYNDKDFIENKELIKLIDDVDNSIFKLRKNKES